MIWDYLIRRAKRTPYSHLNHGDGSRYMERFWLVPFKPKPGYALDAEGFDVDGCWHAKWWRDPVVWALQQLGISIRIHHIITPDYDRAMHDHPWPFLSRVLRGWYIESRPVDNGHPCFVPGTDHEMSQSTMRQAGSWALRHATDRHRVVDVSDGGAVTLFIHGPKAHWWGFYTPAGKVYYRDFDSVHNAQVVR